MAGMGFFSELDDRLGRQPSGEGYPGQISGRGVAPPKRTRRRRRLHRPRHAVGFDPRERAGATMAGKDSPFEYATRVIRERAKPVIPKTFVKYLERDGFLPDLAITQAIRDLTHLKKLASKLAYFGENEWVWGGT